MTPGPVTGRTPIDPGAAQRQLTESASETADSGASFADLLAAMLAPGAAGAQLQAPASAPVEAVFERLDAAEIFNETGLFRGAAPLPSADVAEAAQCAQAVQAVQSVQPARSVRSVQAAPPVALPATIAATPTPAPNPQAELQVALSPTAGDPAPAPAVTIAPADQIAAVRGGTAVPGIPLTRAAYRAMASLRGQPASPPCTPSPGAEAGGEASGSGRVPPRTGTMVAQLVAAKIGAAAAQVSVQAVEGGISVTARVDRLSREERDRLRGEIGELLARHGFGAAQIWLNGEAWPLPQGKDN